ncbi:MAG: hypothetical protein ACLGH8_08395 [Bacteroidia bacterium]
MKKILAFAAVLTHVLTSCSDNDTASTTPPPAGTYSLIHVQGGLMGVTGSCLQTK